MGTVKRKPSNPRKRVGWIERSETHHIRAGQTTGFARAQPILLAAIGVVTQKL
jgi:hypothetical protein